MEPTEIATAGETVTRQGTLRCTLQPFNGNIIKEKNFATIDAARVEQPLTLRHWRQGDRFTPFGMRGSKLLSDYMTDRKMSIIEKEQQLVVTDAKGRIVWVVGERLAAQCATGNDTKEVIILQWNEAD